MSMTNAQAALLAAALQVLRGLGDNDRATLAIAGDYLEWLNDRDADYVDTPAEPRAKCGQKSPNGFRCTYEPHPGYTMHHNDEEGVVWYDTPRVIDKPAEVATPAAASLRHFLPAPSAHLTTCGIENRAAKVTTFVRDVTCGHCKEELGL
jgi:hypothetical protein